MLAECNAIGVVMGPVDRVGRCPSWYLLLIHHYPMVQSDNEACNVHHQSQLTDLKPTYC